MKKFVLLMAALATLSAIPVASWGHALNQSYVYFQAKETGLTGRFEVDLKDAAQAVGLDADGDGEVSADEFRSGADAVFDVLAKGLTLESGGQALAISPGDVSVLDTGDAIFGQLSFTVEGLETTPEALNMNYVFLFDGLDTTHKGYAIIEENHRTGIAENEGFISLVFGPGAGMQELSFMGQSWATVFYNFVIEGIWHIWIGYDHILFLVSLLIASVMTLSAGRWVPRETFGSAFWSVIKIVTLFTIAHSITLSLAALGLVRVPAPLIEFIIALSIAVMALDNIFPIFHRRVWLILFGFGLIHGFGFANVLAPLGVDPQHTAVTLAAFNIGVEIGQAAIVAVLFPILYAMRRMSFYQPVIMRVGSLILIAIALFWAVERAPGVIEGFGRIAERGTLTPQG